MIIKECDIADEIPEEFHECKVLFESSWSSYEEYGYVMVFDFFGEMMKVEDGSCVMSPSSTFCFDPEQIFDISEVIDEWRAMDDLPYQDV